MLSVVTPAHYWGQTRILMSCLLAFFGLGLIAKKSPVLFLLWCVLSFAFYWHVDLCDYVTQGRSARARTWAASRSRFRSIGNSALASAAAASRRTAVRATRSRAMASGIDRPIQCRHASARCRDHLDPLRRREYVPSTAIESFALPKRSIQYSVLWLIAPNEK